jgi:hypothetical protein
MEETETVLREELRNLIEERAEPQQVQKLISQINRNLDEAEQLLVAQSQARTWQQFQLHS